MEVGWHLLRGGDQSRGADMLANAAQKLAIQGDAMAAAVPALEAALEVYRKEGRPPAERLPLSSVLVTLGYLFDRRLAYKYGETTVFSLFEHTGLKIATKLIPILGSKLALYLGLLIAVIRRFFTPKNKRGPTIVRAFKDFTRSFTSYLGTRALGMDVSSVTRLIPYIEPLRGFPKKHAGYAVYLFAQTLKYQMQGRERETDIFAVKTISLLQDPRACKQLNHDTRQFLTAGMLLSRGSYQSLWDSTDALKTAEQLEKLNTKNADMFALHVRMIYHIVRGEIEISNEYRSKLELHSLQRGSTWQVELRTGIFEGIAGAMQHDVTTTKRVVEGLGRLVLDIPSLEPFVDLGRSLLLFLRSDYKEASSVAQRLVDLMQPREYVAWQIPRYVLASICNEVGAHESARRICQEALSHLKPEDYAYSFVNLRLELQLIEATAALGDTTHALRRTKDLIERHEKNRMPTSMAAIHEARALITIRMKDLVGFEHHLSQMRHYCRLMHNPAMVARCENLVEKAADAGLSLQPSTSSKEDDITRTIKVVKKGQLVSRVLKECTDRQELADRAIHLLVEQSHANKGCLYLLQDGVLKLSAVQGPARLPDEVEEKISESFKSLQNIDKIFRLAEMENTTNTSFNDPSKTRSGRKESYRLLALFRNMQKRDNPIGVIALFVGKEPLVPLGHEMLEAVANYLSLKLL
jgi:tetratricopeptide (TPR) repeat protein